MHHHNDPVPSLAILDWGIGGTDFYRNYKMRHPDTGVLYLSDTGAVPYGKQTKQQLVDRLCLVAGFLRSHGVTQLVVACNAMSTVLPEINSRPEFGGLEITGVIEPTLRSVLAMEGGRVGIVGGRRTVLSGAYRQLRQRFPSVTQRIAQPLSGLIESGQKDSPLFQETLRKIMEPLKNTDILILACTHYPAAAEAFQALAPGARLVSPAAETLGWVDAHWRFDAVPSAAVFYTTGNPEEMRRAAALAFGVELGDITQISL
jgi:glutamate racemase